MSKMVSARIPDALYEQGSIQLEKLGSSPSALVNAAFEYLVAEHSLPLSGHKGKVNKKRTLSKKETARLKAAFQACSLNIDIPSSVAYDKNLAHEVRRGKYETLA
ncbi:hypothetical protein [Adlercreutzia sp. ZJ304]|uniref:hypothetical protein n=1 Tax=Adlercreutzia sp. ZJ304 TaxID=2709791 RepID=UPI0013EB5487|nr:hypothetical protein [Adlercreutzia sp. ZJ304]